MRKIILNLAVSLDGFIEGPNGEYDWCFTNKDYGMLEFLNRVDSIFFGRKSYEVLTGSNENLYPGKKKYVFSETLRHIPENFKLIHEVIRKEIKAIKSEPGKDIWLFGGAKLTASLINIDMLDEIQLSVHPILLGKGKPLFIDINKRVQWKLINTKTYSTGLVQLFYILEK